MFTPPGFQTGRRRPARGYPGVRPAPGRGGTPFLAHGRTFYLGLGTVTSDLVVLIAVTGIARGRFAELSDVGRQIPRPIA